MRPRDIWGRTAMRPRLLSDGCELSDLSDGPYT
jgi:hypothetical protein